MALTKATYSMINGDIVNVLDFGATGNGTTDDTAAIQAAIASRANRGGTIFFPQGTYKITGVELNNDALQFQGEGPDVSIILMTGAASKEAIYVKNTGYFQTFSIRDMQIRGAEDTYSCYGIGTVLQLGGVFENLKFKFLDVCITGVDTYNVNYNTITFQEFNQAIRGYSDGDIAARSLSNQGGIADNTFTDLYFYDGNTNGTLGASVAIYSKRMDSNVFTQCTFTGAYLRALEFDEGGFNSFIHCRFERLAAGQTWVTLGSNNSFYNCALFTDGVRWSYPEFAIVINGECNYIDGVAPEYPTNIIKLGPLSNDNEVKWIPAANDSWYTFPYTFFSNPVLDFGKNNLVHIGDADHTYNRVNAWSDRQVQNLMVETSTQTCFTPDGVTKTDRSTEIGGGPYSVGFVYAYNTPTGNKRLVDSFTVTDGYYYCFSAWVASDNVAGLGDFEIIAGDNTSQTAAYATIPELPENNVWYRVFKVWRASTTTGTVGFRLPTTISAGNGLYVSCPQVIECGQLQPNIAVGGYVPTYNATRVAQSPNYAQNKETPSLPNGGTHYFGDVVTNINPVESGSGGSKYIVSGWKSITNSNTNVLNTDWLEMRTLTGN